MPGLSWEDARRQAKIGQESYLVDVLPAGDPDAEPTESLHFWALEEAADWARTQATALGPGTNGSPAGHVAIQRGTWEDLHSDDVNLIHLEWEADEGFEPLRLTAEPPEGVGR